MLVASCSDDGTRDSNAVATSGTLTLLREKSFSDLVGGGEYEASGVVLENGMLRVVFDNSTRVAEVDVTLSSAALGTGDSSASQYEGVTIATRPSKRTYVVTEGGAGDRSAIVTIDERGKVLATEATDVAFVGAEKGLEGIAWLDDVERLLVLCEANSCGSGDVRPGHGVVRSLRHEASSWVTEATLALPTLAAFTDYSDLALLPDGEGRFRIAVVSQESSALWLGTLTTNPLAIADAGVVYGFPTAGKKTQYCSLEGVTFIDAKTIALVSDRPKKSDDCTKFESVHVFAIP
jgi:hypothetical protein